MTAHPHIVPSSETIVPVERVNAIKKYGRQKATIQDIKSDCFLHDCVKVIGLIFCFTLSKFIKN